MTALSAPGLAATSVATFRTLREFAAILLVLVPLAILGSPASADEALPVQLDQARIIKLPERAATLVIGDPLIADVSLQPGGLAVITGKGYGATNVVVLDKTGAVLMERNVEVKGPPDRVVYVYRGAARNTYSCTPECAPRVTLGDDFDYFDKNLAQAGSRSTQALAAGSGH